MVLTGVEDWALPRYLKVPGSSAISRITADKTAAILIPCKRHMKIYSCIRMPVPRFACRSIGLVLEPQDKSYKIIEERGGKEQAVKPVQYSAVSRKRAAKIFYPYVPLDGRFDKVAYKACNAY